MSLTAPANKRIEIFTSKIIYHANYLPHIWKNSLLDISMSENTGLIIGNTEEFLCVVC